MIISIVLLPSAVGRDVVKDADSRRVVESLLRGVQHNGVLIDSRDYEFLRGAREEVTKLTSELGQRLGILLEEIAKAKQVCVVCCSSTEHDQCRGKSTYGLARVLARSMKADCVLANTDDCKALQDLKTGGIEVLEPGPYFESKTETLRREFANEQVPFDKLLEKRRRDLIGRVVRHAKEIHIYDRMLGESAAGVRRFCDGIAYVVNIWRTDAAQATLDGCKLTVVTCTARLGSDAFGDGRGKIVQAIRSELEQIRVSESVGKIRLVVKDDPERVFHARLLKARGRSVLVDPGFDFKSKGKWRRTLCQLLPAGPAHLVECDALKSVVEEDI